MPILLSLIDRLTRAALAKQGVRPRQLSLSTTTLNVYEGTGAGTLPPIVVLHGMGSAGTAFGRVLAGLAPHTKRLLAPELPGHGLSPSPRFVLTPERLTDAMTEALDALLDEPAIVFGNSLGGAVAMHYALQRPERVRGLFLVSPAGLSLPADEIEGLRGVFAHDSTSATRAFLERVYHRRPPLLGLLAPEVRRHMRRPAVRHLLDSVTPAHGIAGPELADLKMPIKLVWGASERILPASMIDRYLMHLPPNASVERPEGFGHCPHLDAPGDLVAKIVQFAQTVAAAP